LNIAPEFWIILTGILVCTIYFVFLTKSWNADDRVHPTVDPVSLFFVTPSALVFLGLFLLQVLSALGIDLDYYKAVTYLLGLL